MSLAVVVHPVLAFRVHGGQHAGAHGSARKSGAAMDNGRAPDARLDEATGLAEAIDLTVVERLIAPVTTPRPATLLGRGKVEEIRALLDRDPEQRPGLVIVDCGLSPVQHRNLEKAWHAKVLDRTGLILEIFGARAQTAEGRLQVDLAHLTYQRSRLVRSWTHLERQRGGAGFLGGPGERQIEADRRALQGKIDRLKKKLEDVRRTRTLQRAKRKRAPYPIVSLVGYTNAGKSTLFNRLTQSDVLAKDMLFATLDPTMRAVNLPTGQRVILSDTVGFISDLPTELVAAFRATLEEVNEADVIVHVRDCAHEDSDAQAMDVMHVLASIDADAVVGRPVIEALNKIDLLDDDARASVAADIRISEKRDDASFDKPRKIAFSALTGEGVDDLCDLVDAFVTRDRLTYRVHLDTDHGAARAWLHAHGDVMDEQAFNQGDDDRAVMHVRLSDKSRGQFEKTFPACRLEILDDGAHRPWPGAAKADADDDTIGARAAS